MVFAEDNDNFRIVAVGPFAFTRGITVGPVQPWNRGIPFTRGTVQKNGLWKKKLLCFGRRGATE